MAARQGCVAGLRGRAAWQGCAAGLRGKAVRQGCAAGLGRTRGLSQNGCVAGLRVWQAAAVAVAAAIAPGLYEFGPKAEQQG